MEKLEKYARYNNKWIFTGWSDPTTSDEFLISTKENEKYIFKTYRWLTGVEETFRFHK